MKDFTRIIVMSDSHGRRKLVDEVLQKHPDADYVFHLGDGADDIEDAKIEYPNIKFHQVEGNCDRYTRHSLREHIIIDRKRIIILHGHEQGVKYTLDLLVSFGHAEDADLVLYGHTHKPEIFCDEGMYIMNPGAMKDGRYGIVDIVNGKLVLTNARL